MYTMSILSSISYIQHLISYVGCEIFDVKKYRYIICTHKNLFLAYFAYSSYFSHRSMDFDDIGVPTHGNVIEDPLEPPL
jgi:hypothetical protein